MSALGHKRRQRSIACGKYSKLTTKVRNSNLWKRRKNLSYLIVVVYFCAQFLSAKHCYFRSAGSNQMQNAVRLLAIGYFTNIP